MQLRAAARAIAVTALTAMTVGVVPPLATQVSAAEPVDCDLFPDDPFCLPPPVDVDMLTVSVEMAGFGGSWDVPVVLYNPAGDSTETFSGVGAVPAVSLPIPMTGGETYGVSIDGAAIAPFTVTDVTCSEPGAGVTGSYTFVHVDGADATCTISLAAPPAVIDLEVVSIGGVGAFDVQASGPTTPGIVITTEEAGTPVGTTLAITPGYPYELSEDFSGPWLVTMACTDVDGNEIPSNALTAGPGEHLDCTITNSLGVQVVINKFYDFVDPAPQFTEMVGSWSETPFDVETGFEYTTTVTHGTYTVTEVNGGFEMTAICDVVLDGDVISTTVDNGSGSITFTAPRGAVVDCMFSNSPFANVTIEKRTVDGPVDTFAFASDHGSGSVLSSDIADGSPAETTTLPISPSSSTITESGPGGYTLDTVECEDVNEGFPIDVSITGDQFTLEDVQPGGEYSCVVYNVASLSVEKTLDVMEATDEDGVYLTEWDIEVTNPFESPQTITVDDEYFFAVGADAGASTVVSDDGVTINPDFDGQTDTVLADSFVLPGGATYSFHVSVPVTIQPDLDEEARLCPDSFSGDNLGFTNSVSISDIDGELDADWACADIPAADITVTKEPASPLVLNDDGSYSQEYVLVVTNHGDGHGTFDLYDLPGFSPDADVLDVTVIDPITDDAITTPYTGDPVLIADDLPLGAQRGIEITVTVRFAVDDTVVNLGEPDFDTWFCALDDNDAPLEGHGLYNEAALYTTDLEPQVSVGCADMPMSNVVLDKTVVGHEYLAADEIAVDFDIVVTNADEEDGPAPFFGFYLFEDIISSGTTNGITAYQFELLGVDGIDEDAGEAVQSEVEPDFGMFGLGVLLPGSTHTWHVRVSYGIDLEGFNGTCPTANGPDGAYNLSDLEEAPGGMFNAIIWADVFRAMANSDGGETPFPFFPFFPSPARASGGRTERAIVVDDPAGFPFAVGGDSGVGLAADCVDVSAIIIDKTVTNDNGFDAEPGDFEFQLQDFGDDVERTMTAGSPYAVVTGDYALVEVEDSRYEPSNFECAGFPLDGPSGARLATPEEVLDEPGRLELEMSPSTGYECAITNDDVSVDLAVSIDDGGASAVAGGAPITYTIEAGIDGGAVVPGDDVTITATLEAGWSWVTGTVVGCSGATIVGAVLTCVVPAATMNDGGNVSFTAQARLAADGHSGTYTALATVGNLGDPPPEVDDCGDVNASCEETPSSRAASITATKVSDAVGGNVARGATLKYTLAVTNHGPSTLLPGTLITDDLPAGLTFVSASGAGWLCNAGDPVVCTNDAVVPPNASLPPLVITTKVANTASGTLTNIGVFTGIVDQEDDVQPAAFVGQRRSEAVVTTATATASAFASVTVKSGSGGRGLPATGVEGLAPTMWVSALTLSLGALALVLARRRRPARG